MSIYVHFIIILQLLSCTGSFFESVHLKGFYNEEFLITCNIHSQIAIIKGVFRTIYNFRINIRSTLNKRCSGLTHCSYIFKQDHFGATKFQFGIIYINYYCISRKHIIKHCNQNLNIKESDLAAKEGFIQNPGYPNFYLMNWNCFWNIQTPNHLQFLRISIIDISLRDNCCFNSLSLIENNNTEYTTCESSDEIFSYKTQSSRIQIKFAAKTHLNSSIKSTNLQIVPKRGFLIHYKDIVIRSIMNYSNNTAMKPKNDSGVKQSTIDDYFTDIIIPSIIVIILFISSSVILFIIYKHRKRIEQLEKNSIDQEMYTFPQSSSKPIIQ